jgi:S-(hydroxymethyl)glutathione dehydrogenase/alcohol dehydrogenase
MNQKARAVVCRELDRPVVVEDIVVEAPRRGEVMIKLAACGVCHSDLSATNGTIPFPPPLVLGHEGAGIVVQVGEGVTEFAVGDAAISSFVSMCGKCRYCVTGRPQLCDQAAKALTTLPDGSVRTRDAAGQPLNVFSGCGVMAEYATLHVDNLVKAPHDVALDRCALVGCGVMTGVGAACNQGRAGVDRDRLVRAVSAERDQGCAAGAAMIVAVDPSDSKSRSPASSARRTPSTPAVRRTSSRRCASLLAARTMHSSASAGRASPGVRRVAQGRNGGDGRHRPAQG